MGYIPPLHYSTLVRPILDATLVRPTLVRPILKTRIAIIINFFSSMTY